MRFCSYRTQILFRTQLLGRQIGYIIQYLWCKTRPELICPRTGFSGFHLYLYPVCLYHSDGNDSGTIMFVLVTYLSNNAFTPHLSLPV